MSAEKLSRRAYTAAVCAAFAALFNAAAFSQPLSYLPLDRDAAILRDAQPQPPRAAAADADVLAAPLRRQVVSYPGNEAPGTVIIDTAHTFLYLTLGGGKAIRYGIGVGREGFTWSGVETIWRKSEWPDWIPPAEMIARQPYLPRWVAGGPGNPLGARALYLGNTAYRIHGTNAPSTIGKRVSSGCIRLRDADVIDLYERVGIGTKVVVLPDDQAKDRRPVASGGRRSVEAGGGGARMSARIFVKPVAADEPRPRAELSSNPTPFGLY